LPFWWLFLRCWLIIVFDRKDSETTIFGRTISPDLSTVSEEFKLADGPSLKVKVVKGYNQLGILFVHNDALYAQKLSTNLSPLGDPLLLDSPISVSSVPGYPSGYDIGYGLGYGYTFTYRNAEDAKLYGRYLLPGRDYFQDERFEILDGNGTIHKTTCQPNGDCFVVAEEYIGIDEVNILGQRIYSPDLIFTDVLPIHWAYDWIEILYNTGFTSGYPDGTYRPENPVTRAEMAVFLLNGMGVTVPPTDGSHPFSDVSGHWAEKYIEELYDQGITGGYPDGTYRPENLVTRAEMAIFLLKGIGATPPPSDSRHPFSDIGGHWAEAYIEELYDQGITGGYPDGTYRPGTDDTLRHLST